MFLIARHAESTWNAQRLWQGQADPPLSARGLGQAEALARSLSAEPLELLVTSDLQRARHTAEIVGRALGMTPIIERGLRELDVGSWEGLSRAGIAARDAEALARFDSGDPDVAAGGAESRRDLERRVYAALSRLASAHIGRRIGVVTHLGVVRALRPGIDLENAGFVRITASALGLAGARGRLPP